MANRQPKTTANNQTSGFKKAARDLGCDESEAAFDKGLGQIGRASPPPKPAPAKKRKPLKIVLPDA